jgi:hypothetical protein
MSTDSAEAGQPLVNQICSSGSRAAAAASCVAETLPMSASDVLRLRKRASGSSEQPQQRLLRRVRAMPAGKRRHGEACFENRTQGTAGGGETGLCRNYNRSRLTATVMSLERLGSEIELLPYDPYS